MICQEGVVDWWNLMDPMDELIECALHFVFHAERADRSFVCSQPLLRHVVGQLLGKAHHLHEIDGQLHVNDETLAGDRRRITGGAKTHGAIPAHRLHESDAERFHIELFSEHLVGQPICFGKPRQAAEVHEIKENVSVDVGGELQQQHRATPKKRESSLSPQTLQ